jgi:hypothetical protein
VLPVSLPVCPIWQPVSWGLEARGVEPLSSSLSTQTSTCLAGAYSEEPTLHRRTTDSRASAISILRIRRGRSADSPACCPRFRRQQASLRKRHGQLSRESEIFVICVYLFWSGFLRGQRTILDMPPALPTMSRSQCAPVDQDTVRPCPAQIVAERSSVKRLLCSNQLTLQNVR